MQSSAGLPGLIAVLLGAAGAAGAEPRAWNGASIAAGAVVRDARGEVLGRIETVVIDPAGRPVQVTVRSRTTGGARSELRALPASSLRPGSDGFATPLRKSEFEVLPRIRR